MPQDPTPVIIRSEEPFFQIQFKEIWKYRDLLKLLVRRDFLTKYRQTVLGPLWFLIQPMLVVGVFSIIFHKIAGLSTNAIPPLLFYLTGWIGWNYTSQVVFSSATIFVSNADIFQKIYFPRLIVPLANSLSGFLTIGIQSVLWMGLWLYYASQPESWLSIKWTWAFAPLIFLHLGIIALGVSLLFSAFTARYRDLNHLVPTFLQLWMYGSAIIYPFSQVPEGYRDIIMLNPVVAPIECLRIAFFGMGSCSVNEYLVSIAFTAGLFFVSFLFFQKAERHASDTA